VSTKASFPDRPKLRKVERFEDRAHGDPRLILHDPLGVAEPVTLPLEFAGVLDLLDGTRTTAQIGQSLRMRTDLGVDQSDLEDFVAGLSDAGWLDDAAFAELRAEQVAAFEDDPVRGPVAADLLYPSSAVALREHLDRYVGDDRRTCGDSSVVGVMVPHGPADLVGHVVGATLRGLPRAPDLIVILGTDHAPGLLPAVATTKAYRTPLGTTSAPREVLSALTRRVPWLTREELRHRSAHSLELAVVYAQYVYGDELPPVLPLLCGAQLLAPERSAETEALTAALEAVTEDLAVLWFASAELSHTGPAYGGRPLDETASRAVEDADRAAIAALTGGPSRALRSFCNDRAPHRPSGAAVMTVLAALLPLGYRSELAAYERCAVPGELAGHMGVAGLRFHRPLRGPAPRGPAPRGPAPRGPAP